MICLLIKTKSDLVTVTAFLESNQKTGVTFWLDVLSRELGLLKLTKKQGI